MDTAKISKILMSVGLILVIIPILVAVWQTFGYLATSVLVGVLLFHAGKLGKLKA